MGPMATEPLTARDLAEIRGWEAAATPGPWEQGVAFVEAPVNPEAAQAADWDDRDDRDHVEPDLLWQVGHLPKGHCRLCEDGPPLQEEAREVPVRLYRTLQRGAGKEFVGESSRRVTFHLHRVARDLDAPLEPISSTTARRAVLALVTEAGETRLVLSAADARFISRARDAVPRLLAEVERLQALVTTMSAPDPAGDPGSTGTSIPR